MCGQKSTFEMDFAKNCKYMAFLALHAAQFSQLLAGVSDMPFSRKVAAGKNSAGLAAFPVLVWRLAWRPAT
jgi:hypothetical protein